MNAPLNSSSVSTVCTGPQLLETLKILTLQKVLVCTCMRVAGSVWFSCPILSYVKPKKSLRSDLRSMVITNMEVKVC